MAPKHKLNTLHILLYAFAILITIGWCRIVYLQVVKHDQFAILSKFNFMRLIKITPPRGNIVDTNGVLLATNKPTFTACWQGTGKNKLSQQQLLLIQKLAKIFALPITDIFLKEIAHTERSQQDMTLAKDISFEQLSYIVEQFCYEPNITVKSDLQRYYPYHELASHVIGYLSIQDVCINGKMGLEKICEHELQGEPGFKKRTVNATGKALNEEEFKTYVAGKTLRTTLNFDMQDIAEQAFSPNDVGTLIIMDPATGALRTLISRPSFNPEIFLHHISQEQWNTLQETHFFINHAFQACYPPASLFKLVTVTAAIEQKIVEPDAIRFCPGYYMFHDRAYHCNKQTGHGLINFKQSLAQSCNIIFFEIGKKISIDTLADYAHRFGLGLPTGVLFPEKIGLIPSSAWKRAYKGERWYQGETLSVAIGQSFLLVTPIQIARMLGGIACGYLVKPRILEDEEIEKQALLIHESTRTFVKECMTAAIEYGTGRPIRDIPNISVYGKTGTAQISALDKNNTNQELRSHGWFIANFAYKNEPPLTLVILVEHAGGSHKPAMIAKHFLSKYQRYMSKKNNQYAKMAVVT